MRECCLGYRFVTLRHCFLSQVRGAAVEKCPKSPVYIRISIVGVPMWLQIGSHSPNAAEVFFYAIFRWNIFLMQQLQCILISREINLLIILFLNFTLSIHTQLKSMCHDQKPVYTPEWPYHTHGNNFSTYAEWSASI